MKNRSKILLALLIVLTLMVGAFTITASAANFSGETKLYLKPSANWQKDGARFAAYFFNNSTGKNAWASMSDADGDGVYEVTAPSGTWANVIFCRMNGSSSVNDWGNKWNQTGDLTFDGTKNLFTINASTWDNQTSGWSKYAPACTNHNYNEFGKCTNDGCTAGHTYTIAGTGAHLGTEWDPANTANDMTFDAATKIYTKVYTNVAAGSYEFKCAQDHAWSVSYPPNNYVLNVAVGGSTITITFNANTNAVSVNAVSPVAQVGDNYFFNLQDAVDATADGDTVVLHADYTGDIYFTRAADVDVTINGNGKTFNGTITIDGKSATYATGSLTIENVHFDATGISKAASINFGVSGNNNTRYITNVSIIKCTFTGGNREKAAIKSYTGGDKNITVAGCSVDNTMHSLLQVTNVTGLEIDNCTVNSKNGINLNNSSDVVVKNSAIEVSGYAVRAGASSQGDSGSVELTNNTLKTDNSEGDPVIELRGLAQKNIDLVMSENVVSGNVHIKGTTAATKISAEANYWDGSAPVVDGTAVKVLNVYTDEAMTNLAIVALAGAGTETDPFLINNLNDLKWFRDDVNAGNTYKKLFVKITADIDLGSEEWAPIGNSTNIFQGTFDGDNHTISNLVINAAGKSNIGFFGFTTDGEIKNLTINNALVTGRLNVGAFAGTPYTSKYTNIALTGHVEINGMAYVGGIGGKNAYANWTDITVDVDATSYVYADSVENGVAYRTYVGGVIGFNGEGSHTFTNISSNIKVTGTVCDIGGIFGIAHYGNNFESISCSGSVSSTGEADELGGIAGVWHNQKGYTVTMNNVSFTGTVSDVNGAVEGCDVIGGAYNASNVSPETSGSLKIDGVEAWTKIATIGDTKYQTLADAFAAAVNGDELVIHVAGTYKLGVSGKSITVTASVDGVAFEGMGAYGMGGANVTFNNITFNWTNENYKGLQHSGNLVYNNCTINGQVFLYGNSEIFNECTFNQTSAGAYNVWTYGAKHVEFNKCTFNSAGKALLVYTESSTHFIDLAITETTFNASAVAAGKAAIEIDTSLTAGANISIDAATIANGFDAGNVSGNTLWNNKKGNATDKNNDIIITVAGEEVLAPLPYEVTIGSTKYTSIQAAIDAAKSGDEISIYNDLVLTNSLYINNKTVTINLNKHTLTYGGTNLRAAAAIAVLTNNATLIVKGNGTVLTNGAIFSIEDGSEVQIVDGTYDVDVTPYLAEGYRVATAPQADGTILYGVVTNTDKTFIGENGNWWVGEYDTGIAAQPKVEIIEVDGVKYWHVNGINTGYLVTPTDAVTPEIKVIDGVWHIDIKDGNGFQSTSIVAGAVDGNGIVSIEKTESNGLIDIYTITYNDGTTTMFTIQNGSNGANGPTGPDGIPGNQGPKGNRGEPGANGASNTWLVNSALYIALGCIALAGGVVLVLNYKRTHWWG